MHATSQALVIIEDCNVSGTISSKRSSWANITGSTSTPEMTPK
jgi:hypothetical protein